MTPLAVNYIIIYKGNVHRRCIVTIDRYSVDRFKYQIILNNMSNNFKLNPLCPIILRVRYLVVYINDMHVCKSSRGREIYYSSQITIDNNIRRIS